MYHVTLDYAKTHFEEIIERAKHEPDGVMIVQDNQSFLLIDKSELESCTETAKLLEDATLLSDIKEAREEYKKGETLTMEQIFEQ